MRGVGQFHLVTGLAPRPKKRDTLIQNEDPTAAAVLKATLWAAAGSALFAFMWVLPKLAGPEVPAVQTALIRYLAGIVSIAPFFLHETVRRIPTMPIDVRGRRELWLLHGGRAACGVIALVFGAFAVSRIPLANAQAIALTNGVFTVLFAVLFLRERAGWRELAAGAVALMGALIVAGPGTPGAAGWALSGVAAAFAQAVFWGAEVVLLRATASRESVSRTLMKVNVLATVMILVVGVWFWQDIPSATILLIAVMGPIAIIGQACNIRAFRLADATSLVPVRYTGIIFAALYGILIFGEWPAVRTVLGAIMIVGGAMWLALRSRKVPPPTPAGDGGLR